MDKDEKLKAYEDMYAEVKRQYDNAASKMDVLKSQGKTKTVSFREAMGNKGFYAHMLLIYKSFGITDW